MKVHLFYGKNKIVFKYFLKSSKNQFLKLVAKTGLTALILYMILVAHLKKKLIDFLMKLLIFLIVTIWFHCLRQDWKTQCAQGIL